MRRGLVCVHTSLMTKRARLPATRPGSSLSLHTGLPRVKQLPDASFRRCSSTSGLIAQAAYLEHQHTHAAYTRAYASAPPPPTPPPRPSSPVQTDATVTCASPREYLWVQDFERGRLPGLRVQVQNRAIPGLLELSWCGRELQGPGIRRVQEPR